MATNGYYRIFDVKGHNTFFIKSYLLLLNLKESTIKFIKYKNNKEIFKEYSINNIKLEDSKNSNTLTITIYSNNIDIYKKYIEFSNSEEREECVDLIYAIQQCGNKAYKIFSEIDINNYGSLNTMELSNFIPLTLEMQNNFNLHLNNNGMPYSDFLLVCYGLSNTSANVEFTNVEFINAYPSLLRRKKMIAKTEPPILANDDIIVKSITIDKDILTHELPDTRFKSASMAIMGALENTISNPAPFELLDGEAIIVKQEQSGRIKLNVSEFPSKGSLYITTYRVVFIDYRFNVIPNALFSPASLYLLKSSANALCSLNSQVNIYDSTEFPLGFINKIEKTTNDNITISCKDYRKISFSFDASPSWIDGLYQMLNRLTFHKDQTRVFAFSHKFAPQTNFNGWKLYDQLKEYVRIGINEKTPWLRISDANVNFEISSTYPRYIVVPQGIQDDELQTLCAYRSRERIPIITWLHPITKSSLSRCAQPTAGLQGKRSSVDEKLVALLRSCNPTNSEILYIMDARPFKAAVGNAVMGKGYENTSNYTNCSIKFLDIENIHSIRNSMDAVFQLLQARVIKKKSIVQSDVLSPNASQIPSNQLGLNSFTSFFTTKYLSNQEFKTPSFESDMTYESNDMERKHSGVSSWTPYLSNVTEDSTFQAKLEATGWLTHLRLLLSGAVQIAQILDVEGASVIIHCSDGWDRTSQLSALAQLILDPFYRTMNGFSILIEKEWCHFGHKFAERMGHGDPHASNDQRAPIFIQFLDSVYQIIRQFPLSFEFNEHFLLSLAYHSYSCAFGTFLFESDKERSDAFLFRRTPSLWNWLLSNNRRSIYVNPLYRKTNKKVVPNCSAMRIVLWESYFFQNDAFATPHDSMPEISCLIHERMEQMNVALAAVNLMYDPATRTVIKKSNSPQSSRTYDANRLSQKSSQGSDSPAPPKLPIAVSSDLFIPLKLTGPKSPGSQNSKYIKFRDSADSKIELLTNPTEVVEKVLVKSPRFSLSPRISLQSPSYPAPLPPYHHKALMDSVPENSEVYTYSNLGPSTFSTSVRPSVKLVSPPLDFSAIKNGSIISLSTDSNAGSPNSSPTPNYPSNYPNSPSNQSIPPIVPHVPQYPPSSKKKFSISPPPVAFNKDAAKSPLATNSVQFKFAINSPTSVTATDNVFEDK